VLLDKEDKVGSVTRQSENLRTEGTEAKHQNTENISPFAVIHFIILTEKSSQGLKGTL
jgi:hypothetical protein